MPPLMPRSGSATMEDAKAPVDPRQAMRQIWPYLRRYRTRIILGIGVLILAKLATLGVPITLKLLVDYVSGDLSAQSLMFFTPLMLVLGYGALRIMMRLFLEVRDYVFSTVSAAVNHDLGKRIFGHLHQLSLRYHLARHTGSVTREIDQGVRGFTLLFSGLLYNILPTIFEFAVAVVFLWFSYGSQYVTILLSALVAYVVYTVLVTRYRLQQFRQHNSLAAKAQSITVDSLLNYETVKYFNNEAREQHRYSEASWAVSQSSLKNRFTLAVLNLGQSLIVVIALVLMMYQTVVGVQEQRMSVGDLVLINTLLLQLVIPLSSLGSMYRMLREALTDVERMFDLLDTKAEVCDVPEAKSLEVSGGAVCFEGVSFAYDPERPILREVSFEVAAGKTTAIVGHSGSGKSTIARLLYRFYDVSSGDIKIDEQSISHVSQESLRAAIGIVPQDTVLFNDTLRFNIAYGNLDADAAAIERAIDAAQLRSFIEVLPAGLETIVGERGLKLSGGEKQRVAIARATLKHPQIMIFDEATSALDSQTEQAILAALNALAAQQTTLIIAHRLSTIVHADQIIVLDDGRLIERGTHEELLAAKGHYAKLWQIQQQSRETEQ